MMNRREAIQVGMSVLSAVGIDGEVATISAANPQMIVITTAKHMSESDRECVRQNWLNAAKGTRLENVKAVVLNPGMKIEVIDAP